MQTAPIPRVLMSSSRGRQSPASSTPSLPDSRPLVPVTLLLLLLAILAVAQGNIVFTRVDCLAKLNCLPPSAQSAATFFEWRHQHNPTEVISTDRVLTFTPKSVAESGKIFCSIIGGHGKREHEFWLKVLPPAADCRIESANPMFLEEMVDQRLPVPSGSDLDLDCSAVLFSAMESIFSYHWKFEALLPEALFQNQLAPLFDARGLQPPETIDTLRLRNVTVHHSGLYRCTATPPSPAPPLMRQFSVRVKEPSSDVPMILHPSNPTLEVREGDSVELVCPMNSLMFHIGSENWDPMIGMQKTRIRQQRREVRSFVLISRSIKFNPKQKA
ncbi:hypothetical protein Ciccas_003751 [Cichlidogyrus casuarinus]|uniref:Ig-like domain-containing protein n=1 Tax=Cichlidogyrus casuarinus TaxID=1844966 RepID=A0ABD2QDI4_9PLAT